MDKKLEFTPELKERLLNAKSPAEINRILGLNDLDMQELKLDDLEQVSGGGHYVRDRFGQDIWITLMDENYVVGSDPLYDKAFILESMAAAGVDLVMLADIAKTLFNCNQSVLKGMTEGGPAYVADGLRNGNKYIFGD